MKKILVPTDFSPVADNALKYAIEIAAEFKSQIYLYHVYSIDSFNYDQNYPKYDQPFAKKVSHEMDKTVLKFKEIINEKGIKVRTYVEEESFYSLFKKKVTAFQIDMIIMGSKGASGLIKVFFGSVAATVLAMAKVPVLIVPPDYSFQRKGKIVLAIDNGDLVPNALSFLQEMAIKFTAKVILLHVRTTSKEPTDKESEILMEGVETTFRQVFMSKNINETIGQFIEKEGGDLLCMIRREKGVFRTLFQKSIIKTQVFSNQVPLLVLPEVLNK